MSRRVQRKSGRKMSTLGWFGIGCGATVLLGLIALAVIWSMVTGEPELPPEAAAGSSGGGSAVSAPPIEQQIQQVQQAARAPQPVPVAMVLRESEINEMIAGAGGSDVSDLKIYLGDGSIAGTGNVQYRGRTIPLTVRGRPVVSDGRVAVEVDEVLIGRLHAPASVQQQVRQELERGIQQLMGDRNVQVERVEVRPDVMTVTGRVGGR